MGEFISRVLVELDKMFDYLLIASAVVAVIAGAAIDNDKEDVLDKAQQRLKDLAKTTKLDREVSFRCGMFFPDPKNPDGLPVSPLLVFNSSWPAEECSTAPDYDRYSIFCKNLFSQFSNKLSLKDPSIRKENRDKGSTIGNDICGFLKRNVKAPFVGGKKSKKFPEGLEISMFSNACGDETWKNSGYHHNEKVCCRAAKYIPCEEIDN